ncbi:MAG: Gldg family protein [Leptospiraceae bacterium]|nr:Gldg family protein [Leptospiraceae bacterium]
MISYIPIFSVVSLYIFFISYDMFLNPTLKIMRDFVFLILVGLDLGNRLYAITKDSEKLKEVSLIGASSTFLSYLAFQLRSYLDVPTAVGVASEVNSIPKVRDFLLVIIVLTAIVSLVYQILQFISAKSIEAQTKIGREKETLFRTTFLNFLYISPLIIAANYFAVQKNYNFDLSSVGKFSYSETSRTIIKSIQKEVKITAFYPRPLEASGKEESFALSAIRTDVAIYLDQLSAINPLIKVQFINADVELDKMGEFPNTSNGTILLRTLKTGNNLSGNPYVEEKVLVQSKKDLEDLEKKIVQGINGVTIPQKKIYFTTLNGEHFGANVSGTPEDGIGKFISSLNFFNYTVTGIGIPEGWPYTIPNDADILAIIGPRSSFTEQSKKLVLEFLLEKKGKLFITIDPSGPEDFSWLLDKAKLEFKNEPLRQTKGRAEIVAGMFSDHPLNSSITRKELGVVFPFSGYLDKKPTAPTEELQQTGILESGTSTFIDSNKNNEKDKDEKENNFALGVILETKSDPDPTKAEEKKGKAILYTGTSWLTDRYYQFNLNSSYAVNSLNWMNQNQLIDKIVSKKEDSPIITLTPNQKLLIWVLGLFGYPLVIAFGLGYYSKSRRSDNG